VRRDLDVDTSGSAVTWSYIDPTPTTRWTSSTDTASDGWTPTHLDLLASTPLGSWGFRCDASFNGNTGTDTEPFTVAVPASTTFPGDPLRIQVAPIVGDPGASFRFAISESNADGSGRTGNAAGTLVDVYNDANTLVVNGATTTEVGAGVYRYDYTPSTTGKFLVRVRTTDASPVSTAGTFSVRTLAEATAANVADAQAAILSRLADLDAQADAYHTNETEFAAETHTDVHEALDLLAGLNITLTGNFTIDNATLHEILQGELALNASLAAHRSLSPEYSAAEQAAAQHGTILAFLGDVAWLIWIVVAWITRHRSVHPAIAVLCDVALGSLVFLPMDELSQYCLGVLTALLFFIDCLRYAQNTKGVLK
jgi:hypothetical protein